jgi:hypothetical protein
MPVSTSNVIGVALGDTQTSAQFKPGTLVTLDDGGTAIYVQAASDIGTYAAVGVLVNNTAVPLTTTNAATTKRFAVAQTSIASGQYGWVQAGGVMVVNLAASCAANVPLFTTATAGVLDDATVSGNGVGLVVGIVANTSISNATAATCLAQFPHISGGTGAI